MHFYLKKKTVRVRENLIKAITIFNEIGKDLKVKRNRACKEKDLWHSFFGRIL